MARTQEDTIRLCGGLCPPFEIIEDLDFSISCSPLYFVVSSKVRHLRNLASTTLLSLYGLSHPHISNSCRPPSDVKM